MTHNGFVYMKNKENDTVFMFYGTYTECLEDLKRCSEDINKYQEIPFTELDLDTLVELLENIMEDRNWHTRASYEPRLIADSMLAAGIDKKTCENAMRNFIIGIEERN